MSEPIAKHTARIGVVGAGRWGQNHISTLQKLGWLAGVTEEFEPTRNAVAEKFPDIALHSQINTMLASDVEAVVIATPVNTHHNLALAALEAGKDVLVEKPMTFSEREARSLVEMAKQKNRILMVGHMLLYQPAVQHIKEILGSRKLGEIYSIHARRLNLGTVRKHENALFSLGVHDLAVLNYLIGLPVNKVQTVGQAALQPNVEDDMHLHLQYENGIQAHLHVSWQWPVKDRGLMVLCEHGTISYDEATQCVQIHHSHAKPNGQLVQAETELVFQGAAEPLKLELEHFAECIRNRSKPISDGNQGLEVVRLLEIATQQLRSA